MTTIFVSHTKEDDGCAERIHQDLEAKGYTTWREPTSLTMESILYPRTIENVILGSAAVVLVWSNSAASSEWVERHILFAQQVKKPIVPVVLDGTDLPPTLIVGTTITGQPPCSDVSAQLLPHLPLPGSADPLIVLSEKAAHEFIRIRKEAIDQAAEMLKRDEQREGVLAILDYLAHTDLMMGVREKAQEVLDTDAKKVTTPAFRPEDSRHIIGVRCKNGHITYFDKRRICSDKETVVRSVQRAGLELDERDLTCGEYGCGVPVKVHVDCRGYR
jgi:TIR domain